MASRGPLSGCDPRASHCSSFSCCGGRALEQAHSRGHGGFSLPCVMCSLPGPGMGPRGQSKEAGVMRTCDHPSGGVPISELPGEASFLFFNVLFHFLTIYLFIFVYTSLLLPTHLPEPSCMRAQSCNPMGCSSPGFSVHGLFQLRILEWVAISFSMIYFLTEG